MTNLVCIDNYDVLSDVANTIGAPGERSLLAGVTVDHSLLEELREADRRLTQNGGRFNRISMEIGWDGYLIKRHEGWRWLGYEDEKQYREAKKIGRSTWYKMIGIAERLSHLKREEFLAMTVENAEQLSEQPMSVKENPELIAKAQIQTSEDFAHALAMDTAARLRKPVADVPVVMKFHVRQSQRKAIEKGLEEWERAHGIDDPGYALELMIAEFRDRLTLVGFISEAIPRLSRAVTNAHSADELEELRKLFVDHIREMGELLKLCSGEGCDEESAA